MTLSFGRTTVATPGPSIIPESVLAAMSRPMIDLYGDEIQAIYRRSVDRLNTIVGCDRDPFMVIGNGHSAWQMAVCNTMSAGDHVLVLESGRFARGWGEMAATSGVKMEILPGDLRNPINPAALEARLHDDPDHEISAILLVHTDTATSVRNDIPAIRAAIDAAKHPALMMVDCIASLGCDPYYMDDWGVDLTVAACQKGLMIPPGLAFVWANQRTLDAYETAGLRNSYYDWEARLNPQAFYELFSGTPPISHLFALDEAMNLFAAQGGIEQVWRRHEVLAHALHRAVNAWAGDTDTRDASDSAAASHRTAHEASEGGDEAGFPTGLHLNVRQPANRSNAVTAIRTGGIDPTRLATICKQELGLVLGSGIGDLSGLTFRIGHMGYLNPPMLLGTIATLEAALTKAGFPLKESGAAAAAAAISEAL